MVFDLKCMQDLLWSIWRGWWTEHLRFFTIQILKCYWCGCTLAKVCTTYCSNTNSATMGRKFKLSVSMLLGNILTTMIFRIEFCSSSSRAVTHFCTLSLKRYFLRTYSYFCNLISAETSLWFFRMWSRSEITFSHYTPAWIAGFPVSIACYPNKSLIWLYRAFINSLSLAFSREKAWATCGW